MPPYGEQLGGEVVCPLCRGVASSEAKMSYPLEGDSLPSSEAEMRSVVEGSRRGPSSDAEMSHPLEGRSATLERGGDLSNGPERDPRARRRSFRGFEGDVNGPRAGLH